MPGTQDHFGFRSALIRLNALVMYKGFGVSPSPLVRVGPDGWLCYAADYTLEDYRSAVAFKTGELEAWKRTLEKQRDWLARRGIRFLLVLACDKHVVYPESMPRSIVRHRRPYRLDELAEYLQANWTLKVVNLRDALQAARSTGRLYHRTDTHWNDLGAYVGYREMLLEITPWFPAVRPLPITAFDTTTHETPGLDLAMMMGLEDRIPEQNIMLEPRQERLAQTVFPRAPDEDFNDATRIMEIPGSSLPRLVMFRDSFASALVPFLAEHFRRSVFVWRYEFDAALIEREKPDVVVLEVAGRRLQWLFPSDPELPAGSPGTDRLTLSP
jgi:alginate O-acetyltransferase complex protein AlgJ